MESPKFGEIGFFGSSGQQSKDVEEASKVPIKLRPRGLYQPGSSPTFSVDLPSQSRHRGMDESNLVEM